ncbi:serine/threonine protein phosphatase [Paenibacillus sp. SYP-B3998]|uniref:Serine/threonine protein phosphatase n=1 Tax=Paenibacillus sp. SYP-B3998 TaxID=2678564 RepID=A0A6G4A7K4_9BACL|nr:serine/threonine protein phosphatase [Paenibacillus sp. SYP-B3998]NEW09801.1 serine/threonine protein phosphatase [Paenibacillus sp. SYP-B3998]
MRKDNSNFKTSFLSEEGTFVRNKEYFAFTEHDDLACWVMAQGLDSDTEMESAEMAVKAVIGHFMHRPKLTRRAIESYLREAHDMLHAESRRVRRKVSLTMIVTNYTTMIWAVAGHTRMYHFRNGRLLEKSKDQSLTQTMINAEKIPQDALERHEERNNLLWYLGKRGEFNPSISRKVKVSDGDVLMLCTRGIWERVNGAEMLDALEEAKEPSDFVDTLEDVLLSKQERVVPNYTVAAIYANKVYQEPPKNRWKLVKTIAMVLIPVILLGGVALYYKARTVKAKAEAVAAIFDHEKNGDTAVQDGNYPNALKEYSEARNASIKVQDKLHTQLLTKKQRTAQLVVDGDTSFKEGDYTKALTSYEKALKEARSQDDYDIKDLEAQISKTRAFMEVATLMKQGDQKFQGQDYEGAKEIYAKAKKEAAEAAFNNGEKELAGKLDAVNAKMAGVQKEKRQLDADKLEKKGDQSYAAQDFEQSVTSYAMAQEVYQEIGMLEKVLGVERKLTKAQEKLNPPITPPITPPPVQGAGTEAAAGAVKPSNAASDSAVPAGKSDHKEEGGK